MRRPLLVLLGTGALAATLVSYLHSRFALERGEIIDLTGYCLLLASIILLYFQIKSSLSFERRRAAHDFLHGPVTSVLLPLEKRLKEILVRKLLLFADGETIAKDLAARPEIESEVRSLVLDILNFYERVAIAIRNGTLDEDAVYDDKGANALTLSRWVAPFITNIRQDYEPRAFVSFLAMITRWEKRYATETSRRKLTERRQLEAVALRRRDPFT